MRLAEIREYAIDFAVIGVWIIFVLICFAFAAGYSTGVLR